MKAVILAAGRGTRMKPLTDSTPKPLLPVAGQPIIQHTIDLLEDIVDEFVIVTGYKHEQLADYFSDRDDCTLTQQKTALGTADAALKAKDFVNGKTIIANGDDIYSFSTSKINDLDAGIMVSEVENPEKYGVIETEENRIKKIVEKPSNPKSNLVNTGLYIVNEDFFEILENVEKSDRGEFEITDAISEYLNTRNVSAARIKEWVPCSHPWNLLEANKLLLKKQESELKGQIAESSVIKGNVRVEEGASIKANSVIEGPALIQSGAVVGPSAYVRPGSIIGRNAKIGSSEIKNSALLENSKMPHFNYVGDSYISRNVNLGAGAKALNVLNTEEPVKVKIKGELVDTGKRKLGCFIGSSTKIGAGTAIKPGRKVGSNVSTDSNEKISKNLPSNSLLKNGEIIEDWN